uniref:Peptidase A2 domain-containing protein n=1 Tax=Panagrolaimus sp. ES5 TaxID=591445 RepID=A0AC34FBV4_9BILA
MEKPKKGQNMSTNYFSQYALNYYSMALLTSRKKLVIHAGEDHLPLLINDSRPRIFIQDNGKNVAALIDTGSTVSIIGHTYVKKRGIAITTTDVMLTAANGKPLNVMGAIQIPVQVGDDVLNLEFVVVRGFKGTLLGMNFLRCYSQVRIYFNGKKVKIIEEKIKMY